MCASVTDRPCHRVVTLAPLPGLMCASSPTNVWLCHRPTMFPRRDLQMCGSVTDRPCHRVVTYNFPFCLTLGMRATYFVYLIRLSLQLSREVHPNMHRKIRNATCPTAPLQLSSNVHVFHFQRCPSPHVPHSLALPSTKHRPSTSVHKPPRTADHYQRQHPTTRTTRHPPGRVPCRRPSRRCRRAPNPVAQPYTPAQR